MYCLALGIADGDCPWKLLLVFIVAGVLVAGFLPEFLLKPVTNLSIAVYTGIAGYKIVGREPKDEYQKNDRFLGWALLVFAAMLVADAFLNF